MLPADGPAEPSPSIVPAGEVAPEAGTRDFDLLAARLRGEREDLAAFVEGLAAKLTDAVPGLVVVERGRSGFRGPRVVRRIAVDAGGDRLELLCDGHDRIETRRARVSGGITLKTEAVDIDTWLQTLSSALTVEAQQSERTRQALERLLLD